VTDSAVGLAAAFAFARRLQDPDFREVLDEHGYRQGQNVVIALDSEPVRDVIFRMMENETSSPCLIAITFGGEETDFRFLVAEQAPRRKRWSSRKMEQIKIAPESSIGMLYSAFERWGEFLPNSWSKPVRFERVPTDA
jgi:hypothetical protein